MRLAALTLMAAAVLAGCPRNTPPMEILVPVPDAEAVGVFHQVRPGENLAAICRSYRANCQEVAEMNGIEDADRIFAGQRIFVPDVEKSLSQPAKDTGEKIAIRKWKGRFIWPVENGVLTSRFGIRRGRRHDGIDIAAPEGTAVLASADGRVLYAGDQQTGYGNLVILKHPDDMITVYAHNQVNLVEEKEQVRQGQVIARVGSTGRSSGPHLHFEIRKRTKPRNPLFFLPKPD
jgi:murein DD-endopeptidase MepM/ murein hydrolase activator NlpD